ncbi:cell division protein ZapA [Microbulbifer harenosus]|uniref:Cell division protein ZapA n=1 Tax=Microbulbifer harenosus TaxID=2576840 RepID=A0ABY2UHQ6_9GAMM|nr:MULTISPECIES: cell division protein ZapA [Microbulbifer]QIL91172.1 cell division protein ZapA [Microbulbifer sp. SH-1]TLM77383.1 cell division protein ZapA [Microbulbifer harenosus]
MSSKKYNSSAVAVTILDKEYRVACSEEEQAGLQASAKLLNERMAKIRLSGSVIGAERIAVMAALNIAHELIQAKAELARQPVEEQMLDRLHEKVQAALAKIDKA